MKLTFKEFVPGGRQDRRGRHRLFSRTTEQPMTLVENGDGYLLFVSAPGGEMRLELTRGELRHLNRLVDEQA